MTEKRTARLNSLLREVISDVIHREIKNPHTPHFITVTQVEITTDLSFAKVFVSVMGSAEEKKKAMKILEKAAGFIAMRASKQVRIRYFPELRFYLDEGMEKQSHIDSLLKELEDEREKRVR